MIRILETIGATAFVVALGIVGRVEHDGDISLMLWTIPLIAVATILLVLLPFYCENRNRKPDNGRSPRKK